MQVVFKKAKINNFLSIGQAEVEFTSAGFVLVKGINTNPEDAAKANGAGKSTIFESIIWTITGETSRGTKDVVNMFTEGGTSVSQELEIDGKNFKIIRYKNHKEMGTNLKVYVNDGDVSGKGIRDTEQILSQYLPDMTSLLISSIIILGQGLPQKFTDNTPSGRKEVLEKLSKSDFMIQDIKNRLTNRKTQLSVDIRNIEDKLIEQKTKETFLKNRIVELTTLLEKLGNNEELKEKQARLQEELNTLNKQNDEINGNVTNLNNKIIEIKEQISNLNIEKEKILNNYNEDVRDVYSKKQSDFNSLNDKNINLQNEINKLKSIKDTCPTCQQKLPHVHKVDTTELEETLNESLKITENVKKDLNDFIEQQRINKKQISDKYEKNVEELNKILNIETIKINEANTKLKTTTSELQQKIIDLNNINNSLNNFEINKTNLQKDLNNTQNDVTEIAEKILYNNIELDKYKDSLEIVNKMNTVVTRDFRGYLLTNVIDFIDKSSKNYAQDIFGHTKIAFKLEGNNINITYLEKDYGALSGGEKQKVDLIVQFAIRDMLKTYLNFSSNILVLDEIFDNLDSIGCDKVVNMIITKMTDVESVYIITHHTDIEIPVDKEIVIIKGSDNVSRIK